MSKYSEPETLQSVYSIKNWNIKWTESYFKEARRPNVNICFYQCHVLYFLWQKTIQGLDILVSAIIFYFWVLLYFVKTQTSHDKMHQPQTCYTCMHAFWLPLWLFYDYLVLANNHHKLPDATKCFTKVVMIFHDAHKKSSLVDDM